MHVDKAAFFLAVSTLAAGGVGGYFAAKSGLLERPTSPGVAERQPAPPETPQAASAGVPSSIEHATPSCDDMVGSPAACPPIGYSADEGGCEAVPTKRCELFKRTMKPRVAERAVACLNALNPAQRCDPNKLSACGHAALMSACSADDTASAPASAASPASDDLASRCAAIVQGCAGTPFGPTLRDCRATLAGMNALGREQMTSCLTDHCADKGLLGCESAIQVR
jgi:hypothetical protein